MHEQDIAAAVQDPKFLSRFWSRVEKSDGCWMWTGTKNGNGYGRIAVPPWGPGRVIAAHRVSYAIAHGGVPDDKAVCHTCDVPSCVNPAHLFTGSTLENNIDCRRKGRANNIRQRFTPSDVFEIRALKGVESGRSIARRYGCSYGAIHRIQRRENWKYL